MRAMDDTGERHLNLTEAVRLIKTEHGK